jgi:hypothetical protein
MLYESNYADLQVLVRSEVVQYHPATGVEINRIPALTANFGTHGGEYLANDPLTGQPERHAIIHGRFFDTEEAKERIGWSDDEHDSVVYVLDKLCREQPFLIARVEQPEAEIVKPWPTYDETHWKTVPVLAAQLGLTEVALAYERANKNRDAVVTALEGSEPVVVNEEPVRHEVPEMISLP